MNSVDSLDLAIRALRSRRNEERRILDLLLRGRKASTATANAVARRQVGLTEATEAITTLEALREMIAEQSGQEAALTGEAAHTINDSGGHTLGPVPCGKCERLYKGAVDG